MLNNANAVGDGEGIGCMFLVIILVIIICSTVKSCHGDSAQKIIDHERRIESLERRMDNAR